MSNIVEFFKKLFSNKNNTVETKEPLMKKINFLMLLASVGVLIILLSNLFDSGGSNSIEQGSADEKSGVVTDSQNDAGEVNGQTGITAMENVLSKRLETVLSQIQGVGEVKVTVNLASTPEKDYAVNTNSGNKNTQEHDQKGGNRTITETNEQDQMVLVRESQGSKEEPVVVTEKKPEVKGVVVVAEGVTDSEVKANVMKATQVYLDIPLYKVIVLPKESR